MELADAGYSASCYIITVILKEKYATNALEWELPY